MVRSIVKMVLQGDRVEEALAILGPMVERTRAEGGCFGCELHRDVFEENVLVVEEWWETEEDLKKHLRSEEYRNLLLVMELARVPPDVKFETVAHSAGFEKIEEARA